MSNTCGYCNITIITIIFTKNSFRITKTIQHYDWLIGYGIEWRLQSPKIMTIAICT